MENELSYVNSFYKHKSRGTWFSHIHGRWYELDGFVMNNKQRHRHVKKMRTVQENTISDHKPKKIMVKYNEEEKTTIRRKIRRA